MSIVHELQQAAQDEGTPVSALLRKTLVVASKLNLHDSADWVQQELNGYKPETSETKLPTYRIIHSRIMVQHPRYGWQPLQYRDPKHAEQTGRAHIYIPVPEIEAWIAKKDEAGGSIGMGLAAEVVSELRRVTRSNSEFAWDISPQQFISILSSVRNLVLQWALKLERDGVHGDQPTSIDKRKAADVSVPGITINSSTVTIMQGGESKSTSRGLLTELGFRVVKAIPEKWIVAVLTALATIGGGVYAWVKGWIQSWLQ